VDTTYGGATDAPINAGTYPVMATVNDPNASGSKSGKLVISQAVQTIHFAPLPAMRVGNADVPLAASASSGLPVSFTTSPPTVATIVNGNLHLVAPGKVTLTASQPGNANWRAASSVKYKLTIGPAILTAKTNDPHSPPAATTTQPPANDSAIRAFYTHMKRLVEAHDVPGFLSLFSPDYFHAGYNLSDQLEPEPELFDAITTFTFEPTAISVTGCEAMVSGTAAFAFDDGTLAETWLEADTTNQSPGIGWLRKSTDGWRIIGDQQRALVTVTPSLITTPGDARFVLLLQTDSSLEISSVTLTGPDTPTTELHPDALSGKWGARLGPFTRATRPPVGTLYSFSVTFADGSLATYQDSIKAWGDEAQDGPLPR
jgi:hypothetical protein